ncbi:hypothetical protein [Halorubrum halodurans]|uniref:hypothetical protein n=1 Tax=Halorubrum halodurans TaxID=1383851 RepID=UPI0015C65917|nr:hypothetical protein [Halorubrum halodurans]
MNYRVVTLGEVLGRLDLEGRLSTRVGLRDQRRVERICVALVTDLITDSAPDKAEHVVDGEYSDLITFAEILTHEGGTVFDPASTIEAGDTSRDIEIVWIEPAKFIDIDSYTSARKVVFVVEYHRLRDLTILGQISFRFNGHVLTGTELRARRIHKRTSVLNDGEIKSDDAHVVQRNVGRAVN